MLIKNILPKRSTQDIIEKIADYFFVLFIVARQAFRFTPGFTSIWPIVRYGMYGIVLIQIVKRPKIKKNGFLVWTVLFLSIGFFCSVISKYPDNGLDKCTEVFYVLVDAMCVLLYCLPKRKTNLFFWAFLISGAVIFCIQMSNFSASAVTSGANRILNRVSLTETENPNLTALKLYMAFISGSYLIYFQKKYSKIALVLSIISAIGMVLTGSRKTFIISVVVIALLFISGRKRYLKMALLVIGATVAYDAAMNNPVVYNIIGWRLVAIGGTDESSMERARLLHDAINTGLNNPIFGVGLHNSMFYTAIGKYAHNNFAEIFADLGLIGFSIFYSLYILYGYRVVRFSKEKIRRYWLVFILGFLAIDYGQVSYNLFTSIVPMVILCIEFTGCDRENYGISCLNE